MKKILILLLLTIVCSCKTTKPSCDAYGKTNPDKNTLNSDIPIGFQKTR
jgi:hypothetical protein